MKYRCSICGYIYDEALEGVAFADLPDDWQCPLCGAPKDAFEPVEKTMPVKTDSPTPEESAIVDFQEESMQQLSVGQMAALCSNLARGCEKQYMPEESALFNELAEWFTKHTPEIHDATVEAVSSQLQKDIQDYPQVNETCIQQGDRGAQRVLGWSEKVTRMLNSLMSRYQREGDSMLIDNEIWVCSICGFVYIGKSAPDLCPVCKVPSWRFNKIERRK